VENSRTKVPLGPTTASTVAEHHRLPSDAWQIQSYHYYYNTAVTVSHTGDGWLGRDDVAIGAYNISTPNATLLQQQPLPYVTNLVDHFDSPIKSSTQVDDAVAVYRRVLSAQPDRSVAISSIGIHTNLVRTTLFGGRLLPFQSPYVAFQWLMLEGLNFLRTEQDMASTVRDTVFSLCVFIVMFE
jgi:hypothetical protein